MNRIDFSAEIDPVRGILISKKHACGYPIATPIELPHNPIST
jgi:hypothetical protein